MKPLIARVKSDPNVRADAADALGGIASAQAIEPWIAALKDESKRVRISAAWTLGKIGDDRAVNPLISALKDESKQVRDVSRIRFGRNWR